MRLAKRRAGLAGTALAVALAAAGCSDDEARKQEFIRQGDTLARDGNVDEAVLQYKNAVKIDYADGDARLKLAEAYSAANNLQAAAREVIRAADVMPGRVDAQLRAARVLLLARQFGPAQKYADAALKVEPANVEALIARAHALAGLRQPDDAIAELERAMAASPADARPQTIIGGLNAAAGNREEAERAFRRAIDTDPGFVPARLALAHYYWSANRPGEAETTIKDALTRAPKDISANRLLAMLYLAEDRDVEAEGPLERLHQAHHGPGTMSLGDLYVRTGREGQARALYEGLKGNPATRAAAVTRIAALDYAAGRRDAAFAALDAELQVKAPDPLIFVVKSRWLARERRGDEALETARKALAIAPGSAEVHYAIATAQLARGEQEEAIAAFKDALQANPRLMRAALQLSALLFDRAEYEQAVLHAASARTVDPQNAAARITLARALMRTGDLLGAENEVKALAAEYPRVASVHSLHGQVLAARGDQPGALRAFDRALALDPADVASLTGRVLGDIQSRQLAAARSRLTAALARAPKNEAFLILAGQLEAAEGRADAAETYFRRAIDAAPNNGEAYAQLARFYASVERLDAAKASFRQPASGTPTASSLTMIGIIDQLEGREDDAIRAYERAIAAHPDAAVALNNLAYLLAERGQQVDRAIELAQRARRLLPNDPNVSDTLGWALYKSGAAQLAVRELTFSVHMDGRNPGYLYHLGLAYARLGQMDHATEKLTRALELDPDSPDAATARATLASFKS